MGSSLTILSGEHRLGRVLSFFPVVGIGNLPTPHPQASVPPPLWFRGEGHTRWREREWESLNSDEGTYTVILCIYIYFVVGKNGEWYKSLVSNIKSTLTPTI
jgi:hypothetical protein